MDAIRTSCKNTFTTTPNPKYKNTDYKTFSLCMSRKIIKKHKSEIIASSSNSEVDTNENHSVFEVKLDATQSVNINNQDINSLD